MDINLIFVKHFDRFKYQFGKVILSNISVVGIILLIYIFLLRERLYTGVIACVSFVILFSLSSYFRLKSRSKYYITKIALSTSDSLLITLYKGNKLIFNNEQLSSEDISIDKVLILDGRSVVLSYKIVFTYRKTNHIMFEQYPCSEWGNNNLIDSFYDTIKELAPAFTDKTHK